MYGQALIKPIIQEFLSHVPSRAQEESLVSGIPRACGKEIFAPFEPVTISSTIDILLPRNHTSLVPSLNSRSDRVEYDGEIQHLGMLPSPRHFNRQSFAISIVKFRDPTNPERILCD